MKVFLQSRSAAVREAALASLRCGHYARRMGADEDIANRIPITAAMTLASMMMALDTTIANVALPHLQGAFSATQDQTAWVLTSYIVATAIMTPLAGQLASQLGYKRLFLISIGGFTVASMLCGSAANLAEIVIFRFAQGLFAAPLQPLSQAVMLDLYPPRQMGQVMAVQGASVFLGPIVGPVLGGWLTDSFSWRWVFYINLPLGLLALAGLWLFMSPGRRPRPRPFDFLGFGALVVGVVALQLMLDRGSTLDWFSSPEICGEAVVAAIGFYAFAVQTAASPHPFFDRALALDRNFLTANFFSLVMSVMLFSTIALQPPLMQSLMGYSVLGAGLVMAPRGFGAFASMLLAGRLVGRVDTRLLLLGGLLMVAAAMLQMSHFDLSMGAQPFVSSGAIQGLGTGLIFVPMSVLAFATLDPRLRAEAAIVFSLLRNIGQSVGISATEAILTNRLAVAHGDLAAAVQPSSPAFAAGVPAAFSPATTSGLVALNGELTRQAAMVSYVDVFHLGLVCTVAVIPLILILRPPRRVATLTEVAIE